MEGTAAGWSNLILSDMNAFRNQSLFTDVTLVANDGTAVPAHSLILVSGSDHFKEALQRVRASNNFGSIMVKLAYSSSTVQNIVNFLYEGKISVPQAEMREMKAAAKTLKLPVLEALCDTYTKNLDQFMQANEIPQDSEVSVQITHHVGTESEEHVEEDRLGQTGVAVELADPQGEHAEEANQLTLELDTQTNTVYVKSSANDDLTKGEEHENLQSNEPSTQIDNLLVPNQITEHYNVEDAYPAAETSVISNVVSLEEVSKTVSIESLLANQTTVPVSDVLTKLSTSNLEDQIRSSIRAPQGGASQVYRYRCNICSKDFSSLYRLKGHHATHFGEKAHQCGVCGKRYIQIEYLREHESVHRTERPYSCVVCNKDFRILRHLKKHQITHSDKRPYACTVCNKTFQRSDRLKAHLRTHTGDKPYQCDVCSRKFSLRETLMKHKDTHSEFRPFKCSICLSEFKRKDGLMIHLETHRAECRFVCGVPGCGSGFNQLIHLKKHINVSHQLSDVDSAVIERPRITAKELSDLLAQAEEAGKGSPDEPMESSQGDVNKGEEPNSGSADTGSAGPDTTGRSRRSSRQQATNSTTDIATAAGSNEIGLVIRTRSQKAADGQVEELTSVETVSISALPSDSKLENVT